MQRLQPEDECEKEIKATPKGKLSLTLNKSYDKPTSPDKIEIKTPEYFPSRRAIPSPQGSAAQGPIKMIKSAKMIHCVTENGITKCFSRSSRETTRMVPGGASPTASTATQQSRIL